MLVSAGVAGRMGGGSCRVRGNVRSSGAIIGMALLAVVFKIEHVVGHHEQPGPALQARASRAEGRAPARDSAWTIEVGDPGTFVARYKGVEVGSIHYVYWGKAWSWVDMQVKAAPPGAVGGKDAFSVEIPALGVTIHGSVRKSDKDLTFAYDVETSTVVDGDIRGGLEFTGKMDSLVLAGQNPDVTLRPEKRGFDWTQASGPGPSVEFNPPMTSLYFERGHKGQIRCYFDEGRLEPRKRHWTMTIRLPPGGAIRQSIAERYGNDDVSSWTPNTLVWDKWPIDVSFLNDGDRPAGRHGRLRARGDQLVFQDGTVGRFWGANVAAYALFTGSKAEIANQAKRIAALGYNLVRIHHHDSDWVTPNVFAAGPTTQFLNDAALDAIDWWVKCLRDEGVYVWLDLKTGRKFRDGDGVSGFPELAKADPIGRGFDYVDPRMQALEQAFTRQYLARPNRYTGRSYLEDPAIIATLVTNEDDLTTHFGNSMLPDQGNPVHEKMLRAAIEAPAATLGIPTSQAMRTWEPGPSKLVLADIEARLFSTARAQMRALGFGGLVVGTSYWGNESLYSLASLAAGDIVDVHSYGEQESLGTDPRYEANFISWIGAAQLVGKPLSMSEWNVPYPTRDRFTAPLYLAAVGDLQGWDAPMLFTYTQDGIDVPGRASVWSTAADPALTALMPAAAVMFRQQHVKQARETYCFHPTREALYGTEINPTTSAALRTIVEQSRLVVALPDIAKIAWDDAASVPGKGDVIVTDPNHDFLPPGATKVRSDTGELERDWAAGIETIDTPMSQAAVGWIGGRSIALRDVELRIDTPKAAVALTSLDGRPIASSTKILLTVVGQIATGPGDVLPFLAQPVRGSILLRSSRAPRVMIPLSPTAHPGPTVDGSTPPVRLEPVPGRADPAGQLFALPAKAMTHWWLLQPPGPASPARAVGPH
jgi:hypothetical protein